MPDRHPPQGSLIDTVFDDYVRRREAGEDVDFEALCRTHPEVAAELREREATRRLLDRFLPGPLDKAPGGFARDEVDAERSDVIGSRITDTPSQLLERLRQPRSSDARYRVLGEIGRGGMGVVLSVWDDELRRKLAMKASRNQSPAASDPTTGSGSRHLGRFLDEAQITSQLDHPGIVPVHEIGITPDGSVYFTMRLVRGESLRTIFARVHDGSETWNPVRAVGVLLKVCEAMAYAHSRGVVHRDLKPANVMVGRYGEVYVMDWGLARVLGRRDAHDVRLRTTSGEPASAIDTERSEQREDDPLSPLVTMDGDVVGTPSFMAPEQARGELDAIGPRSDVYAVGAMLYQLLSGEVPYLPPDGRVSSRTLLARVLDGPPRSLANFGRKAPAPLVAICEKAMARSAERRYGTMGELADDLRAYLEGRTVAAYRTGAFAEAASWVRRNRPLAVAFGAIVLLLVGGFVYATISEREARDMEAAATLRADVLWMQAQLAELRRRCTDVDRSSSDEGSASTFDWWRARVRILIEGAEDTRATGRRAGLAEFRAELQGLRGVRTPPSSSVVQAAPFPRLEELERKRRRLLWYRRMLGEVPWPSRDDVRAEVDEHTLGATAKQLNETAWSLVDPRDPCYGFEVQGLVLAEMAFAKAEREVLFWRRIVSERSLPRWVIPPMGRLIASRLWTVANWEKRRAEHNRINAMDTLAAAQVRVHRFPEARILLRDVTAVLPASECAVRELTEEMQYWEQGRRAEEKVELTSEVDALGADERAWTTFPRDEGEELWRRQLVAIVSELEALEARLGDDANEAEDPRAGVPWVEAIERIAAHPAYGGLRIAPQVDLVPLGEGVDAPHLWEFAHVTTGSIPRRGADGRLDIEVQTGLVFVLLPAGTARVLVEKYPDRHREVRLAPFFLSKFEMTEGQWCRLRPDWNRFGRVRMALLPITDVNHAECLETLARAASWLTLPSAAQWQYACFGETSRWRLLPEDAEKGWNLVGSEPHGRRRIGSDRPQQRGFHDIIGNVREWCRDASSPYSSRLLAGDSLDLRSSRIFVWWGGSLDTSPQNRDLEGVHHGHESYPDLGLRPARPLLD